MDLSSLPDDDFDLSAVNHSNWLSALPFQSLSPELADAPTAVSKETPENETTSDTPFQEHLANKRNLSDFVPRAYIHSTPRRGEGESHCYDLSFLLPSCSSSDSLLFFHPFLLFFQNALHLNVVSSFTHYAWSHFLPFFPRTSSYFMCN